MAGGHWAASSQALAAQCFFQASNALSNSPNQQLSRIPESFSANLECSAFSQNFLPCNRRRESPRLRARSVINSENLARKRKCQARPGKRAQVDTRALKRGKHAKTLLFIRLWALGKCVDSEKKNKGYGKNKLAGQALRA